MNEGRNLVKEALKDADELRQAATEAAKKQLVESLAPQIKKLVESALRGAVKAEDTDRIRRGVQDDYPGESHTGFEEGKDKGDEQMPTDDKKSGEQHDGELDMEALMSMIPGLHEDPDADPDADPDMDPATMGGHGMKHEDADPDPDADPKYEGKKKGDDEEEEKVEETVEISEEQLNAVYEEAMKAANLAEVEVKKGFSDMTKAGELEDVAKDVDKGLADVKKGDHHWEQETPPHKQDWTVKEVIKRGLAENRALRTRLREAINVINSLRGTLHEVNLFNSKVLQVNRIFNGSSLTKEQKLVVMESIDRAKTIDEVKSVAEAIASTFKAAAGHISEGRNPRRPVANAQRARRSGTPNQEVLRESVDRDTGEYARLRQLAGLDRLVK